MGTTLPAVVVPLRLKRIGPCEFLLKRMRLPNNRAQIITADSFVASIRPGCFIDRVSRYIDVQLFVSGKKEVSFIRVNLIGDTLYSSFPLSNSLLFLFSYIENRGA